MARNPHPVGASTRRSPLHGWEVSTREARDIQLELAGRVERQDRLGPVTRVAGVDVGLEDNGRVVRAAVAVLTWPALTLEASAVARLPVRFSYVPGLLSFREIPVLLAAWQQLPVRPDLVLCDGQGIAHPRRLGLASHLGLWLDLPTIGVAKSRLVGVHGPLPAAKGEWVPLQDGEETVGAVLRSRAGCRPLFVSVGHRVSLDTAVAWTLACTTRYRLPETTRHAHRLASGPA